MEVLCVQGGGANVLQTGSQNNVSVSFKRNYAFRGSGLGFTTFAEELIERKSMNIIRLEIADLLFAENGDCDDPKGFGGGAYFSVNSDPSITNTHSTIKGVNLTSNCAMHGGGVTCTMLLASKHFMTLILIPVP